MNIASKEYLILRHAKLKVGDLSKVGDHNERRQQPLNAAVSLAASNINLLPEDARSLRTRWDARLSACKITSIRSNAVAAVELFYGFSPSARSRIDAVQFGKDCLAHATKHYGHDNVISARLHRDEKTPHCQIVVVPVAKKSIRGGEPELRLAAAEWLDGPDKLRRWQSLCHQEVGIKYGLARGEEGSTRQHVPQKALYQTANAVESVIAKAATTIPPAKMFETNQSHRDRIEKHLVGELSPLVEAAKQGDLAQVASVAAAKAEQRRTEAEIQRRLAEADRDKARSEIERLLKEHQDRLRRLSVSVTLERILGSERRRHGEEWIIETDALKYSVASDDRRFCEFKAGRQAGSGAISAVISAVECSYKDAVRWLAAHFAAGEIEPCVRAGYDRAAQQLVAAASAHPITLTEQLAKFAPDMAVYWADVRQYLIQNRCLPPAWIDQLHQSGDVWANQHRSACFSLRNATGELTGAVVRGTRYKFKQTIGSKMTGCFFFSLSTHAGQRIAITESPVEAISLAAIEQDRTTVYTSTAGRGGLRPILLFAKERGGQVVAAQNDDPAGHQEASATLAACADLGLRSQRIVPPLPDWNDSLRFMTNELNRVLRTDPNTVDKLRSFWQAAFHSRQLQKAAMLADSVAGYTLETKTENTITI